MEVDNKKLHEHALPIAMLLLAFSLISAGCYGYYTQVGASSEAEVARGLVSRVVHVQHGTNGLAHFSLGNDQSQSSVNQAVDAGRVTELSLTFGGN